MVHRTSYLAMDSGRTQKCDALKINPSLKPYAALTPAIKSYDQTAVRNYAEIFKKGGYAIVKQVSGA